jgi:predicted membrane-bound spermidine synthase
MRTEEQGATPSRLLHRGQAIFFLLFAVSGFSGLIYESIWSHYLKLYLGHAAYAQALVLAIFMGGMSLGAWLCALLIYRLRNPLQAYALVEGTIGFIALAFDGVFRGTTGFVLENVFGHVDSVTLAQTIKWGSAALLILPQSILLGATFPLMSNGLLRRYPGDPGRTLGMLYFTNSIGGAAGVLTSGFVLIALVGLPGTMLTAGIINVLLAIVVYGLSKTRDSAPAAGSRPGGTAAGSRLRSFILLAALITGLSSFVYEIVWIRMLSMVLGASTHAFELMLSAFITGLAIGGYIVRKRMSSGRGALVRAAWIQMLMGIAAFATLLLYDRGFDLMAFFMSALSHNDNGYVLFVLASHGIALVAMLPATIFAGMTLPLFTAILLDRSHGEGSVGEVYAFNTLGAIAGTVLTLFFLLPLLGVEHALLLGAFLDVIIGVGFLVLAMREGRDGLRLNAALASALIVCLVLMSVSSAADPRRMASGVFRTGKAIERQSVQVLEHYDGSTASVTVLKYPGEIVSIFTNGKPDASASLNPGPSRPDEPTMLLTAALPLSIKSDAKRVAVVGFGAGMSTHTLLGSPDIERVDTVEIERAMYEGARSFGIRSERAYTDPRSHVVFEDAKTFFYQRGEKYDMIVSEPSNPWVSGVSSLFTTEFYRMARAFLNEGGVLAQWLHAYETNERIVHSILKALAENFEDFHVYATNHTDLVIVASTQPDTPLPSDAIFRHNALRQELERVDIRSAADLRSRFLADKAMLMPVFQSDPAPVNSDYFPFVDLNAARTLFTSQEMAGLHQMRSIAVPVMLYFRPELVESAEPVTSSEHWLPSLLREDARSMAAGETPGAPDTSRVSPRLPGLDLLAIFARDCEKTAPDVGWEYALLEAMMSTVGYLDAGTLAELQARVRPSCRESLSAEQSRVLDLFEGYAGRDFGLVAESAAALLEVSSRYKTNHREFFLASLLVGLALAERGAEIRPAWGKWRPQIFPNSTQIPYPLILLYASAVPAEP